MVPVLTTVFCVITLLVSLILPILALVVYALRHKKQGIWSAWGLGALGFVIPQMCIRSPILAVLQKQNWFALFAQNHLFAYTFCLALTAGLFELAGRFASAQLMRKNLTAARGLAAGMGHGGIEAMAFIGTAYINNLVFILLLNSGGLDALVSQTAAAGGDPAPLLYYRDTLCNTASILFLLAGLERLLTMIGHAAMSMLVCYGVAHKKALPCALVCLAIHTCLDMAAGIPMLAGAAISQRAAYCIVYLILVIVAAAAVYLIRELRRRWNPAP